jgi:DNA-binding transcriptional ArsR family regulator
VTVGALLADKTRATIISTLLSRGLTSASALALRANVSRPLASNHLKKLTEGGLIVAEPQGRQRLYRLSSQGVAQALEALIQLAPPRETTTSGDSADGDALRRGRLCYDHLAGGLDVALADGLCVKGFLEPGSEHFHVITPSCVEAFGALGIDVEELVSAPQSLTRVCPDWSEQRQHLAGSLGGALTGELLRRGWCLGARRAGGCERGGFEALTEMFGVEPAGIAGADGGRVAA